MGEDVLHSFAWSAVKVEAARGGRSCGGPLLPVEDSAGLLFGIGSAALMGRNASHRESSNSYVGTECLRLHLIAEGGRSWGGHPSLLAEESTGSLLAIGGAASMECNAPHRGSCNSNAGMERLRSLIPVSLICQDDLPRRPQRFGGET